ncbi:uncharacterized protein LOC6727860 isoform X1 [Drosophila simulans]|uniref:GD19081 n=1 Tax=Drosophila simulans TaxID=7240 RepID=B4QX64_DROSI|nr:uncharacterized protein LOC6727860 isoform X1 [Drosophila simulans]EDX12718.1 GD19081 [Drosophila simulans]KMZ03219.1 uncharacterized protein Dsimw501_GD19081, isoform A [Drosophila simulans]
MCEPSLSDLSTFLYLDMLADILMQDSLELESDFNTKLKFLKEQEHICLDNAQNALPVDETLKSVNHIMLRVEMELHENEINLIEAEKAVTKLEQSYPSPEILAGQTYPLASTTYQDLLSILMSTKKTAEQCNQIKEEVATYNEQISAKVPSVNLVTKLIDCHNNTLESMEKQIEKLQNQVTQVQKEFELLNKEYESQFHAMCPCKKIKELKTKRHN